jgi:hypothetical protein
LGLRRSSGRWLFLRPAQLVLLGLDPPLQFGRVGWLAAAMKIAAVAALCGELHRGLEEVLAQHQAGTEADEQGGLADMGLRHCR